MNPDQLRAAIVEIYGPTGQRTMARYLTNREVIRDADGSQLRKMLSGSRPILPAVAGAVRARLAEVRAAREKQTRLERLVARVRRNAPRASLVYAQILMRLDRGDAYLRDLAAEMDDDANSSTVNQAVLRLEEMGVVSVDRGPSRAAGYTVTLMGDTGGAEKMRGG